MRYISDYEHLLVLVMIFVLFVLGLEKRKIPVESNAPFSLGKDISAVLKGIGCIFVLLGHFEKHLHIGHEHGIWFGRLIYMTTSNIGLVWFMFISGYGLTVSFLKNASVDFPIQLFDRLGKIFKPLLMVTIVSIIIYFLLPITQNEIFVKYTPLPIVELINNPQSYLIKEIFLFIFGWGDWYIVCIVVFYVIFYFVSYLNGIWEPRNSIKKFSLLLTVLLLGYYIIMFILVGKDQAHYYRLTWAFLFGHLFANYHNLTRQQLIVTMLIGLSTFIFEGPVMILSFTLSILGIYTCLYINRLYIVKKNGIMGGVYLMGSISYFFYLLHERLGWFFIIKAGCVDLLFWICVTIMLSTLFNYLYNKTLRI